MLIALWLVLPLQSEAQQLFVSSRNPAVVSPKLRMFESTFRLVQIRVSDGQGSLGTVFLLSIKSRRQTEIVAVTAKHVLEAMTGDYATLELRAQDSSGETLLFPCELRIREQERRLYTAHPSEDVAVFKIALPAFFYTQNVAQEDWLVSNESPNNVGLEPGDRIFILGFPLGVAASRVGYPILRAGAVASYPILPFGTHDLLVDAPAFEGDSGGPAYLAFKPGTLEPSKGEKHPWILGLVTGSMNASLTPKPEALGITTILTAPHIREVLDMLPRPAEPLTCHVGH